MSIMHNALYAKQQNESRQGYGSKAQPERPAMINDGYDSLAAALFAWCKAYASVFAAPLIGAIVVFMRWAYNGRRKRFAATCAEAGLIAMAAYCIQPVFDMFGVSHDMAIPFAWIAGYIGADRLSQWMIDYVDRSSKNAK